MHVTVMPVSAYMALAFVFGFIPNKLMMMMMNVALSSKGSEDTATEMAKNCIFSRPYCPSVACLSVTFCIVSTS